MSQLTYSCSRYTTGFYVQLLGSVSNQFERYSKWKRVYVTKSNDFFQLSTSHIIYFSKYIQRPFPMRQDAKRILPERQREKIVGKKIGGPICNDYPSRKPDSSHHQSSVIRGNNKTGVYNGENGRDAKEQAGKKKMQERKEICRKM